MEWDGYTASATWNINGIEIICGWEGCMRYNKCEGDIFEGKDQNDNERLKTDSNGKLWKGFLGVSFNDAGLVWQLFSLSYLK